MSVITKLSTQAKKPANGAAAREPSEFDGLWINAGVMVSNGETEEFVRLPRGIAISDLQPRKIYDSMDPKFAADSQIMNQVIAEIQKRASGLAEGESMPINLELRLYRKQEEANVEPDQEINDSLVKSLFG